MSHKLGICIPYRNRKEHLERLVPHLSKHLTNQGIEHKFYVANQVDYKLFNRGAMKNIAAKHAFEDGCDYIAWHDVDMLPFDDTADYSYPEDNPRHIATKLSKYNYGMGYEQYFGGVVLFTKEQAVKTNGYSNDYWDWGQEDDDLFWRCHYEGYTTSNLFKTYENKKVANFNGNDSTITVPTNREISSCLHRDHTISLLINAQQQPEKVPIWLVGDPNKRFIEYPILRKDGSWTWGVSFNNSRAISVTLFNRNNQYHYNWGKKFEGEWVLVTMSYSKEKGGMFLYLNDSLTCQMNGIVEKKPFPIEGDLRPQDAVKPFMLGRCTHTNTHYKGKIAHFKIYNRHFDDINDMYNNTENLVLNCDFNDDSIYGNDNVEMTTENIEITEHILPHRIDGKFYCLPHVDEGFVNGTWKKGETTAKNEKRFVTEMQQRKIDYKTDGLSNLQYTLVDIENFTDNCVMLNVTL